MFPSARRLQGSRLLGAAIGFSRRIVIQPAMARSLDLPMDTPMTVALQARVDPGIDLTRGGRPPSMR